jgi:hypothetical protein
LFFCQLKKRSLERARGVYSGVEGYRKTQGKVVGQDKVDIAERKISRVRKKRPGQSLRRLTATTRPITTCETLSMFPYKGSTAWALITVAVAINSFKALQPAAKGLSPPRHERKVPGAFNTGRCVGVKTEAPQRNRFCGYSGRRSKRR